MASSAQPKGKAGTCLVPCSSVDVRSDRPLEGGERPTDLSRDRPLLFDAIRECLERMTATS